MAKGEWQHIVVGTDGSTRVSRLDKQDVLVYLRLTDREFMTRTIKEMGLEEPETEIEDPAEPAEIEMMYGEYSISRIAAGWVILGYNVFAKAVVSIVFREDGVYATYTKTGGAVLLTFSREGKVEVVEAPLPPK
jgi:hypothetical protein